MSNKTITIQQGTGDDALEMTVQVTQEELDKMEEIRSKDPSAWEGRGLDLVKAAKDAVIEASEENAQPKKSTNWKLILWIVLGVLVIIGTIIFAETSRNNEQEASQKHDGFDEFYYSQNNRQQPAELNTDDNTTDVFQSTIYNEDHLRLMYDTLVLRGYEGTYIDFFTYFSQSESNRIRVYEKLVETGSKGSYEHFLDFCYNSTHSKFVPEYGVPCNFSENFTKIYKKAVEQFGLTDSEEQFYDYFIKNPQKVYEKFKKESGLTSSFEQFIEYSGIPYEAFSQQLQKPKKDMDLNTHKTFYSEQYEFTYQYDDNEFEPVEKTNKNSHCVMKLQSPVDEVKSTLVSIWENAEFSSSYDTDFISSCQSVDEEIGKVISSAVKTKVDGVNALKSELIISPMGKSYYAAIYRIIHKKRMYMLNIYIPIEEYNKDKSYGDKYANNFKFK